MTRSVLVTGATSGIGLETALAVARRGFRTYGSARSEAAGRPLRERAAGEGLEIEVIAMDLAEPHAGEDVLPGLGLWGLVNNAGYMNVGTLEDVPMDSVRAQFETMVFGPIRLAQLVLPGMRATGEGRIVTVSSALSHATMPMIGWYVAAKHAVAALHDALRMEVADFDIDVVTIEPGAHRTDIWRRAEEELLERRDGSPHLASYDRALDILRALEPRMEPPERVAEVIANALTVAPPRPRYPVGADAVALEGAWVLPRTIKERAKKALLEL